jgi:DNA-binding transcriptional LysR family regulator
MSIPVEFDTHLSLYKLEVLVRVVEEGTVTGAASVLHISQPAVSGHLKSLEDYFGVKVFEKDGRRIRLTDVGHRIHAWATGLLRTTGQLHSELDGLSKQTDRTVTVAATTAEASAVLPNIVFEFRRSRPDAVIRIRSCTPEQIYEAVRGGTCDFAVAGYLDAASVDDDLELTWLAEEELVLVAQTENGYTGTALQPADLASIPFVCTTDGTARRQWIDEQLRHAGVHSRNVVIEMAQSSAIKDAVAHGAGVALLSRSTVASELTEGVLREVRVRGVHFSHAVHMVTRRGEAPGQFQQELQALTVTAFAAIGR